jgi:uncharacterized protein (DUF2062 family)
MVKRSIQGIKRRLTRSAGRRSNRIYQRFLKLRGDPHAIAMGLSLGFFVGMSPLMGLHSVIAVTVAAVFKWSKIAALIGVFVTNPLTVPLIYPLTYTLGAVVLGNPVGLGAGGLNLGDVFHSSPHVLANLFVGGGLIGLAGGAFSYVMAIRTIRQYRRRRRLRPDGEVPFAAVRRRLMRVARRQRRTAKHRPSKARHPRQGQPSRRHSLRGLSTGPYAYAVHSFHPRRGALIPLRRVDAQWGPPLPKKIEIASVQRAGQ